MNKKDLDQPVFFHFRARPEAITGIVETLNTLRSQLGDIGSKHVNKIFGAIKGTGMTIAYNPETHWFGVAVCGKKDSFSRKQGRLVALAKSKGKSKKFVEMGKFSTQQLGDIEFCSKDYDSVKKVAIMIAEKIAQQRNLLILTTKPARKAKEFSELEPNFRDLSNDAVAAEEITEDMQHLKETMAKAVVRMPDTADPELIDIIRESEENLPINSPSNI